MASVTLVPAGRAAFPGANGKIAFPRDGKIYVMNPDGTGQTSLTAPTPPALDADPAWSADGSKIVFTRCDGVIQCDIAVMNADGSGQTNLTNTSSASEGRPSWSPDGTKIAFHRHCGMRCIDIWTMNADGSGQTNLTNDTAPNCPFYAHPAWSPDGAKIAFQASLSDTNVEIYTINPDGTGLTQITANGINSRAPDWSPDGTKIAFDRGPAGSAEIYVMNSNGSGQTNITNAGGINQDAAWSPDGTKIAFVRQVPGTNQIWVMNANGTGQTPLTAPSASVGVPDWQPLDATAPTITIATPPEGAVYTLNQVVDADYACDDEVGGSGLASCVGNVADGAAIDTATVGPKAFTVDAADNAGNAASATHAYSVIYDFGGFFPPVDNVPVFNMAKAGSAIPVKFSLGGDHGLNIFAAGYPKSQPINCDASARYDGIEETMTAGSSSLSYDATTDRYAYVWKTEKAWANTCRTLTVRLNDGTDHVAHLNFTK